MFIPLEVSPLGMFMLPPEVLLSHSTLQKLEFDVSDNGNPAKVQEHTTWPNGESAPALDQATRIALPYSPGNALPRTCGKKLC